MPSPVEDRPGLLIRDPYGYSGATIIVPPPLIPALECFDGERTELDLRAELARTLGRLDVGDLLDHLRGTLDEAGFLENERLEELKEKKRRAFAEQPFRVPAHAGSAYPEETGELRAFTGECLAGNATPVEGLVALAAPHVSPEGGWESYRDAFLALPPSYKDRVFVVLGTSHYGEPEIFGLTRKPYVTPFGQSRTETRLVDWLERRAPRAVRMEDYCHAIEHSIEFQVVFLQAIFGPEVRILPILCGPFQQSMLDGSRPESHERVREFLDALAEMQDREGGSLCWVLGVDMAHMGRRYGDRRAARANEGWMEEVERRDTARIGRIVEGDAEGFWSLVQENRDDLKWCGTAPFYSFLRAVPGVRGRLRRYQQWNIDEQSVVSFAALEFTRS
jgi:AmmeMemoRadiSam system protein B